MRTLLYSLLMMLYAVFAYAQAPQRFSFQGVARKADGKILGSGSNVVVKFTVHQGSSGGQSVYEESHNTVVMSNGIFNAQIGGGTLISGDFGTIQWHSDNYYLQVQLDIGDGILNDIGSTQMLSVPYSLHSTASESWMHNAPVVQTGTYAGGGLLGAVGDGSRLIWYPRKAAFCAGYTLGSIWNDGNIGLASVSMGSQTRAKGTGSVALGYKSYSDGLYAVAMGEETVASGQSSFAIGRSTVAKGFGSVAVGAFNDIQDSPANTLAGASGFDRIFQIGNGVNEQSPSNAITVLRNGNVGIGNNVLSPAYRLDVGGRARIHHSINTAGIHFDNSSHNPAGFVGMINDNKFGL
jgi:hypothetical protein